MSPEGSTPPPKEPTLITPESAQECLDLEEIITTQVELWQSRSHSPVMRKRSMAHFIVDDCQPLGREPIDYLPETDFGGTRTHEEAVFMNEYEKRRFVLSDWVSRDELDATPVEDVNFAEYFSRLEAVTHNPNTPAEARQAFQVLKRLYVLREQVSSKIHPESQPNNSAFVELFNRLVDDLY